MINVITNFECIYMLSKTSQPTSHVRYMNLRAYSESHNFGESPNS